MFNKLFIQNFKCFPQLELPLSDLTILAGANASGKSSVIQAILMAYHTSLNHENIIDTSSALEIAVGNPSTLISQNPIKIDKGDFFIGLSELSGKSEIYYFIDKLSPLKLFCEKNEESPKSRLFYLNAERMGPRLSYPTMRDDTILSDGSNAAYLIDRADIEGRTVPGYLLPDPSLTSFSACVEQWMDAILGDVNLSVSTNLIQATADIRYGNALAEHGVLPTLTGFGISYILSIVTIGLWCASEKNSVLIVENPEAHLHPSAQSNIGKFLELVSSCGVQVIIETHSEHVIDGVRLQAALLKNTENVMIHFFSCNNKKISTKQIHLNPNGELSQWPEGFFDQKSLDLRELFQIRRQNANK